MSILSKKLLMGLCCLLPIGSSLSSPSSSSPANDKPIVLRCGESYNGLKFTENGKLTFNEINLMSGRMGVVVIFLNVTEPALIGILFLSGVNGNV